MPTIKIPTSPVAVKAYGTFGLNKLEILIENASVNSFRSNLIISNYDSTEKIILKEDIKYKDKIIYPESSEVDLLDYCIIKNKFEFAKILLTEHNKRIKINKFQLNQCIIDFVEYSIVDNDGSDDVLRFYQFIKQYFAINENIPLLFDFDFKTSELIAIKDLFTKNNIIKVDFESREITTNNYSFNAQDIPFSGLLGHQVYSSLFQVIKSFRINPSDTNGYTVPRNIGIDLIIKSQNNERIFSKIESFLGDSEVPRLIRVNKNSKKSNQYLNFIEKNPDIEKKCEEQRIENERNLSFNRLDDFHQFILNLNPYIFFLLILLNISISNDILLFCIQNFILQVSFHDFLLASQVMYFETTKEYVYRYFDEKKSYLFEFSVNLICSTILALTYFCVTSITSYLSVYFLVSALTIEVIKKLYNIMHKILLFITKGKPIIKIKLDKKVDEFILFFSNLYCNSQLYFSIFYDYVKSNKRLFFIQSSTVIIGCCIPTPSIRIVSTLGSAYLQSFFDRSSDLYSEEKACKME